MNVLSHQLVDKIELDLHAQGSHVLYYSAVLMVSTKYCGCSDIHAQFNSLGECGSIVVRISSAVNNGV